MHAYRKCLCLISISGLCIALNKCLFLLILVENCPVAATTRSNNASLTGASRTSKKGKYPLVVPQMHKFTQKGYKTMKEVLR